MRGFHPVLINCLDLTARFKSHNLGLTKPGEITGIELLGSSAHLPLPALT